MKETTFTKIVERTSKLHAYQATMAWAKSSLGRETIFEYLERKIAGHKEFLDSLDVEYDYTTQSLKPKDNHEPR